MDDERRRAERGVAAGEPDAAARVVIARLRAGEVDAECVELAARLGEPAAARALGWPPVEVDGSWLARTRLALARRLLDDADAPRSAQHVVSYRGPPGSNDGRRFVLPPRDEVARAIGDADPWEVRATYGEGELVIVLRASRGLFTDIADLWVELGLTHEELTTSPGERRALARDLLERSPDACDAWHATVLADPLAEVACTTHGFASDAAKDGFRALLGPGPHRAVRITVGWNDVTDLLEDDRALYLAHWSTSA